MQIDPLGHMRHFYFGSFRLPRNRRLAVTPLNVTIISSVFFLGYVEWLRARLGWPISRRIYAVADVVALCPCRAITFGSISAVTCRLFSIFLSVGGVA